MCRNILHAHQKMAHDIMLSEGWEIWAGASSNSNPDGQLQVAKSGSVPRRAQNLKERSKENVCHSIFQHWNHLQRTITRSLWGQREPTLKGAKVGA